MAKKVKEIKLQIPAGQATPAPPVGTALGPAGINIGDFVNRFNEATKDKRGNIIPVIISVYDDRTFDFIMKTSPASQMILKAIGKEKGSGKPNASKVGVLSKSSLKEIAEAKMVDLNANDVEAGMKIVAGTARSMGVDIEQ